MSAVLPSVDMEGDQVKKQQPKRESASNGDANMKVQSPGGDVEKESAVCRERVLIELPVAEPRLGYVTRRLDVRMSRKQSVAAQRLYLGLMEVEAKLENGAPVNTVGRAIAWVLERV